MPRALWFIVTVLLLLSSCNTVKIHDEQFCSPLPNSLGAVCDNFLEQNQLILTEPEWEALQVSWQITECTSAQTLKDIKVEVEEMCSLTHCDEQIKTKLLNGLVRIQLLGGK